MIGRLSSSAKLLTAMFGLTLVCIGILAYVVIRAATDSASPTSSIHVLRDVKVEVPQRITLGEQFTYHATGRKVSDANVTVRRQIECFTQNRSIIETIDTVEPPVPAGPIDIRREMTIATYKQNLKGSDRCRLIFASSSNYYARNPVTNEERVVPVTDTIYSNYFQLVNPNNVTIEPEAAPLP